MKSRVAFVAMLMVTSCVTAPKRVDVDALVKRLGPVDARHELEVRLVDDPKDIAARLALAKLCEQQRRPSQALEQLDAVVRLGGPIGTRWHDEDRARFARLLHARGLERATRGAPTAIDDLERARSFGAKVGDAEMAAAKLARAIVHVRHIDAKERATGIAMLKQLGKVPASRGDFGAWLWSIGAKRAAWEELAAWHDATKPPRDERLQTAYLVARAWWTPYDGAPPAEAELVGPERCRYGACKAAELVENGTWSEAIAALRFAPLTKKVTDPDEASAWLVITLAEALHGDGTWAALFASRVDTAAIPVERFPAPGRAAFALVTGRTAEGANDGSNAGRFLAAAVAAARGAKTEDVRVMLGRLADTRDGLALAAVTETNATAIDAPYAAAVARYIASRTGEHRPDRVRAILDGYARDPLGADRLARDVVAEHADAAAGHAFAGALFDAIEDPARARASWQAAVDDSRGEPAYVRGLAEAIARANDPDAAMVFATQAAAAGDPAPVWTAVAKALHGVGADVHALQAARFAIDLASGETIGEALDVTIAASDALGRPTGELRERRARVAPPIAPDVPHGPRWNARDPRGKSKAQLVELAGDRDIDVARAAIRSLR